MGTIYMLQYSRINEQDTQGLLTKCGFTIIWDKFYKRVTASEKAKFSNICRPFSNYTIYYMFKLKIEIQYSKLVLQTNVIVKLANPLTPEYMLRLTQRKPSIGPYTKDVIFDFIQKPSEVF